MRYRYWVTLASSLILAVVFLTSGLGKLLGHSAFLLEVSSLFINPALAEAIAATLPWVEIILGLCLLAGILTQIVSGGAVLLVAAFIFHNSWMIAHGWGYKPCGCLGVFEKLFQGRFSTVDSLYVDIGLLVLALAVYFCYQGNPFNLRPWFLQPKPATPPGKEPAE